MDTVTYPEPEVQRVIEESFVAVKCNTAEPQRAYTRLLGMARPLWTPAFLFLSPERAELRRLIGYLPPGEFLPELKMAVGLVELERGRSAEAHDRFRRIVEQHASAHAAPEALYWAGIAAFRRDGKNKQSLVPAWLKLRARYPHSTWWASASCIVGTLVPDDVECAC